VILEHAEWLLFAWVLGNQGGLPVPVVPALLGAGALAYWYYRATELVDRGPLYREYAYITNGGSNTVSVIDLRTFRLAKTIQVGLNPTGVAANTLKNEIYVANTESNNISVIDAERNHVVATIGVHGRPYFIERQKVYHLHNERRPGRRSGQIDL